MVPGKLVSLLVDYTVLLLCYLSFVLGCEDWCVSTSNLEVVISRDTENMLKAYADNGGMEDPTTRKGLEHIIKQLKSTSYQYRFFKYCQRLANLTYARMLIGFCMMMAIVSNTLFSIGFIILLSALMYN